MQVLSEWTRATQRGGVEWDYCAVSAEWDWG